MHLRSSFKRSVLMLFGTASKMIPMESFMMWQVVIITIIEKKKVHSGSAILAFGCNKKAEHSLTHIHIYANIIQKRQPQTKMLLK